MPLWAMMETSHETRWTLSHGAIHLVFHHPARPYKQNLAQVDREEHPHPVPGGIPAVCPAGQDLHPDHVIHLYNPGQEVMAAEKTARAFALFFPRLSTQPSPAFPEPASAGLLPHPPPAANGTLACLRTIVLLT